LFVQLVRQGRVVYDESIETQAERADRTWGKYRRVELSPRVAEYQQRFRAMRDREVAQARQRG
jgi:nicotinate phosphoribosyltransferase